MFCLIIVFLILSFLKIRAERRQKSISVEFSFATVFVFKHYVSAAYVIILLPLHFKYESLFWGLHHGLKNSVYLCYNCSSYVYIYIYGKAEVKCDAFLSSAVDEYKSVRRIHEEKAFGTHSNTKKTGGSQNRYGVM